MTWVVCEVQEEGARTTIRWLFSRTQDCKIVLGTKDIQEDLGCGVEDISITCIEIDFHKRMCPKQDRTESECGESLVNCIENVDRLFDST